MAAWLVPLITQVGIPLVSSLLGGGKGGGGGGGAGGLGSLFSGILGGLGGAGGAARSGGGGGGDILSLAMQLIQSLMASRQDAVPAISAGAQSGRPMAPIG